MSNTQNIAPICKRVKFASERDSWMRQKYVLADLNRDLNRSMAKPISKGQCQCGRVRYGARVQVLRPLDARTGELKNPYFGGVVRCGSVWSCATCSAKIAVVRGREIKGGIEAAIKKGYGVSHITVTIRHNQSQRLDVLIDALLDAWRTVRSGRAWMEMRERIGYIGMVRAVEVTHGLNGWHPHLHCILVTKQELTDEDKSSLKRYLFDGVRRCVIKKHGLDTPSLDHCIKIQDGGGAGAYVSKMGLAPELASHWTKQGREGHRTPWQILRDYGVNKVKVWDKVAQTEVRHDRWLWLEYSRTMKGRHQIRWTPSLKKELAVHVLADSEAIDESDTGAFLELSIPGEVWDAIRDVPNVRVDILRLIVEQDADAARSFIQLMKESKTERCKSPP